MSTRVIQWLLQADEAETATAVLIGPEGPGWVENSMPTFVQAEQPEHDGPYQWWDTTGGNLSLWIEDGN